MLCSSLTKEKNSPVVSSFSFNAQIFGAFLTVLFASEICDIRAHRVLQFADFSYTYRGLDGLPHGSIGNNDLFTS